MANYTSRIWDKVSPINGCPAEVAIQSLEVTDDKKVIIISKDGTACYTETVDISISEADTNAKAQELINQYIAGDASEAKKATQPSLEDRVKSLEAFALGDMGV